MKVAVVGPRDAPEPPKPHGSNSLVPQTLYTMAPRRPRELIFSCHSIVVCLPEGIVEASRAHGEVLSKQADGSAAAMWKYNKLVKSRAFARLSSLFWQWSKGYQGTVQHSVLLYTVLGKSRVSTIVYIKARLFFLILGYSRRDKNQQQQKTR